MTGSNHELTRRQALKAAGVAGATYLLTPALASTFNDAPVAAARCAQLTPELTEGPYWVDTMLRRSDVRADTSGKNRQAGVPLTLSINVVDSSADCKALNGVAVDIWHANAYGLYSDESSQAPGGGDSGASGDTISDNFLRGYQITGKDRGLQRKPVAGQVSFQTIWPGWYTGRAIHIHVRVRELHSSGAAIAGYTTQLFFSDSDNDRVLAGAAPYKSRSPQRDPTTDENDTVLARSDFATNIVAVRGSIDTGYETTFNVALTTTEANTTGSLAGPNSGGPGGPGGRPPEA